MIYRTGTVLSVARPRPRGGRGAAAFTLTLNFTRLGKLLQDLLIAILAMRISFVCIASAQLPGTGLRPSSPHAWRGTR